MRQSETSKLRMGRRAGPDRRYLYGSRYQTRTSGRRRAWCWIAVHAWNAWDYSTATSCEQSRTCVYCGAMGKRTVHTWDRDWKKGADLHRKCTRCGATESRDIVRDRLCAELGALGVKAVPAPRGRPEEECGEGPKSEAASLGIVDITGSNISWVDALVIAQSEGVTYKTEYGIPNPRTLPPMALRSVRVKTFPIFGGVVDVRWDGDDKGTGVAQTLGRDPELREAIMSAGAEIALHTSRGCRYWLITRASLDAPSAEEWGCYEKVGRILAGKKR